MYHVLNKHGLFYLKNTLDWVDSYLSLIVIALAVSILIVIPSKCPSIHIPNTLNGMYYS